MQDMLVIDEQNIHDAGICNFCTRKGYEKVWTLKSKDLMRRLIITMCNECRNEFIKKTSLLDEKF